MMYLGRSLEELGGRTWPMCDLLPIETTMLERRHSLGYREVTTMMAHGLLGRPECGRAATSFTIPRCAGPIHPCTTGPTASPDARARWPTPTPTADSISWPAMFTSTLASNPDLAPNLVGFCRRHKEAINA